VEQTTNNSSCDELMTNKTTIKT